ncbi:TlpA disulfide reductase family protein [Arachidicoccus terrestris]|uniref:TlpA disulfide reductase family protein n=1 Tax=Arachidicoccus terrestris TaxID=2875539 RepID=UPI00293D9B20|nr:TlpA disulfide reductase family protein [Arachidicoccus terrestris]
MQNKNNAIKTLFCAAVLCSTGVTVLAQNKQADRAELDSIQKQVTGWLKSNTAADRDSVRKTAYALAGSRNEKKMAMGAYYLKSLGQDQSSDSLNKVIIQTFPKGFTVLNNRAEEIYKQTDPAKQEQLFKKLLTDLPEKKDQQGKVLDEGENIVYDYIRNAISSSYIKTGQYDKAVSYADQIVTKFWKGEGYAGAAGALLRAGQLDEAKMLYKKAIDVAAPYFEQHAAKGPEAFAAIGYPSYLESYAGILTKEGKFTEALPIIEKAFNARKEHSPESYMTYMKVLSRSGQEQKAFEIGDEALRNGAASEALKDQLKVLYAKVKKDGPDFDSYLATAMQQLHEKFLKELPETMLDLPSQNFSLKDMEGKTVQLSDYLGKTVILDFWATWCGPCKRSFPAMQMAVNKYATDKDVVFLFIDTWERTPDADQQVKKFISANNYSFRVLLDRKPAVSGDNMVVEKYGITGIPTKFVIDPNGKIRFRLTGFGGGNDAAVEEISAMIELARKG